MSCNMPYTMMYTMTFTTPYTMSYAMPCTMPYTMSYTMPYTMKHLTAKNSYKRLICLRSGGHPFQSYDDKKKHTKGAAGLGHRPGAVDPFWSLWIASSRRRTPSLLVTFGPFRSLSVAFAFTFDQ
eukprot:3158631-Pyramimonas_sp.AAC.1